MNLKMNNRNVVFIVVQHDARTNIYVYVYIINEFYLIVGKIDFIGAFLLSEYESDGDESDKDGDS
jgi:hypothetical protein